MRLVLLCAAEDREEMSACVSVREKEINKIKLITWCPGDQKERERELAQLQTMISH